MKFFSHDYIRSCYQRIYGSWGTVNIGTHKYSVHIVITYVYEEQNNQ